MYGKRVLNAVKVSCHPFLTDYSIGLAGIDALVEESVCLV